MDEVAVRGVHLDAVEAGVGRVARAAAEVLDDLADLVGLDRRRRLHVVRDARRRPHRQPRPRRVVHAAVVRELQERERAVLVDLLAHPPQVRARTPGSHTAALLCIWYAVVGCTCAWPAITVPTPPRAYSAR